MFEIHFSRTAYTRILVESAYCLKFHLKSLNDSYVLNQTFDFFENRYSEFSRKIQKLPCFREIQMIKDVCKKPRN